MVFPPVFSYVGDFAAGFPLKGQVGIVHGVLGGFSVLFGGPDQIENGSGPRFPHSGDQLSFASGHHILAFSGKK